MTKQILDLVAMIHEVPIVIYLERAPLKEVLGGEYSYREGEGKCCGRAHIKAAG